MPQQPIDRDTLSTRVYREIKEALISGAYMPGERLTLHTLASELEVSVTPVREALMRLVSEHALRLETSRMIAVPKLSPARYLELRTIRLALEPLATRLAADAFDEQGIAALIDHDRQFQTSAGAADPFSRMVCNQRFHFHIYRQCGHPVLLAVIEGLWASLGPILRAYYCMAGPGKSSEPDSHAGIVQALERGNGILAAEAMEQDILGAGSTIMRFLQTLEKAGDGRIAHASEPRR